ncbi:MAG: ribosome-recycling factor [Patescibacteria group bacterium]|nr:MAG: ribosome-recycling factor [Patescibacteria group bacterium]
MQDVLRNLTEQIQKVLDLIKHDLGTMRTGRAAPSLVENIPIVTYGGSTKLKVLELATISASDPQTLVITPFDQSTREDIRKGILESGAGLNPVDDGRVIRITIPPLSQERREELTKLMRHKLENGRIMIRQARHDAMTEIKKMHEEKMISDDDMHRLEKEVQKIIDETMETIDSMGKQKEEELMQI